MVGTYERACGDVVLLLLLVLPEVLLVQLLLVDQVRVPALDFRKKEGECGAGDAAAEENYRTETPNQSHDAGKRNSGTHSKERQASQYPPRAS